MIGLFFGHSIQALDWATAAVIIGIVAALGEMWRDKRGVAAASEVEFLKEKIEGMSERLHRISALVERLMTLEEKVDTILVGRAMASKQEEEEE